MLQEAEVGDLQFDDEKETYELLLGFLSDPDKYTETHCMSLVTFFDLPSDFYEEFDRVENLIEFVTDKDGVKSFMVYPDKSQVPSLGEVLNVETEVYVSTSKFKRWKMWHKNIKNAYLIEPDEPTMDIYYKMANWAADAQTISVPVKADIQMILDAIPTFKQEKHLHHYCEFYRNYPKEDVKIPKKQSKTHSLPVTPENSPSPQVNPPQFILGDIHRVIMTLPANSIDFVYTNPPFGTTNCAWDKPLIWEVLFCEMDRALKPGGVIALHCSIPFTYDLIRMRKPKYHYVWRKKNSTTFFLARRQPLR